MVNFSLRLTQCLRSRQEKTRLMAKINRLQIRKRRCEKRWKEREIKEEKEEEKITNWIKNIRLVLKRVVRCRRLTLR